MKTVLIGLGNLLLSDEGIGVHAINTIKLRYSFEPPVEVIDGGTLGLDLLHFFEDRDLVVILDAVNFNREPGYISVLRDDEIPARVNAKLTVHHIGLSDILSSLKLLNKMPKRVTLIGIQPSSLEVGVDMTELISSKMDELIRLAIEELEQGGHRCVLLSHQR